MYAVFPLNIVVLPNEEVALHLFEPRYRELYSDYKNGKEFVILNSSKKGHSTCGTTVIIEKVIEEFPDGTVDLIVKGKSIIKISEFIELFPSKLYSGVEGIVLEGNDTCNEKLAKSFDLYLNEIGKKINRERDFSLFYVANRLELGNETKNELIELFDYDKMNFYLLNEINFMLNIRKQEEKLNHKFHLN